MIEVHDIPNDLDACQALLQAQAASLVQHVATITSKTQKIEELTTEMEKLRKLLSQFVNGHRSEKRILPAENQSLLPFDSSEEFQAAQAEAEAQAEAIVQTYTVTRSVDEEEAGRIAAGPSAAGRGDRRRPMTHRRIALRTANGKSSATTRPRRWSTSVPSCTCW